MDQLVNTAQAQAAPSSRAAALLKLLGNRNRLQLVTALQREERCVSELERRPHIRQPTLSQQLTVLRRHGIGAPRRAGKHIYYRLTDRLTLQLLSALQLPAMP